MFPFSVTLLQCNLFDIQGDSFWSSMKIPENQLCRYRSTYVGTVHLIFFLKPGTG